MRKRSVCRLLTLPLSWQAEMASVKQQPITKTCLYNFDPLKPHFYIVKLGFTGVYIIFLNSAHKHRLWVLVRTASSRRFERVPTTCVLSRNMKNIRIFLSENFDFMAVKFSVYLNRHVFVMRFYSVRKAQYHEIRTNALVKSQFKTA